MANESKRREVTQLLRDYRSWKTAYGGVGVINLQTLGQFGPAGLIYEGMAFDKEDRGLLRESFTLLDHALTVLRHHRFTLWLALVEPYLSDPADPAVVDDWRNKAAQTWDYEKADKPSSPNWRGERWTMKRNFTAWWLLKRHDKAIRVLAILLADHDLHAVFPARIVSRKKRNVEDRNNELFSLYKKLREEGETRPRSIRQAAEWCDYSEKHAYDIVSVREGRRERRERKKHPA